jgi:hypothetical protein
MKSSDRGGQFENSIPRLPKPHGQGPRHCVSRPYWPHDGQGKPTRSSPLSHAPTSSIYESLGLKDTPQASHSSSIPFPPASNTWRPIANFTPFVHRPGKVSKSNLTAAR